RPLLVGLAAACPLDDGGAGEDRAAVHVDAEAVQLVLPPKESTAQLRGDPSLIGRSGTVLDLQLHARRRAAPDRAAALAALPAEKGVRRRGIEADLGGDGRFVVDAAVGCAPGAQRTDGKACTKHGRSRHRNDLHGKSSMKPQYNPTIG